MVHKSITLTSNIQCPVDLFPQEGFFCLCLIELRIYRHGQNKLLLYMWTWSLR